MADYQSVWEGKQIDDGLGRIINGELDKLVGQAATSAQYAQQAETSIKQSIATIPPGAVPVINDLTTGGGTVALSAEQGKVLNERLDTYAHPNLLRNPNFLVNRNGKAEYSGAVQTVDGWKLGKSASTLTVADGYVIFAATDKGSAFTAIPMARQYGTYTLSFFVRGTAGKTVAVQLGSGYRVWSLTGGWDIVYYTVTITEANYNNGFTALYPTYQDGGGTAYIAAAKLELGDRQTLARQLDDGTWQLIEAPDYARDYALCQMYSPTTGEWVGSQHSNDNLLDNAWWAQRDAIINQRSQNEYTGAGYGMDRWKCDGAGVIKLALNSGFIRVSKIAASSGNPPAPYQMLEPNTLPYAQTYTLSVLVRGSAVTRLSILTKDAAGASSEHFKTVNVSSDDWSLEEYDYTVPVGSYITAVRAGQMMSGNPVGAYYDLMAAKLELGPVSTLAHREGEAWVLNDPPPNKQQELAKCQRYQINLATMATYQFFGIGRAIGATSATISIPLPVTMRTATPALEVDAAKLLLNNTAPVVSMVLSNASASAAKINVTVAGGLTAGEACFLTNGNNTVPLILNANL